MPGSRSGRVGLDLRDPDRRIDGVWPIVDHNSCCCNFVCNPDAPGIPVHPG